MEQSITSDATADMFMRAPEFHRALDDHLAQLR